MAFLTINTDYFDTERRVVAEEYRLGREQPYGSLRPLSNVPTASGRPSPSSSVFAVERWSWEEQEPRWAALHARLAGTGSSA